MSRKKLIAGAATLAVLAGGASAVAATTTADRKAEEQAFLADAAKRLGVSSEQLTSALTAAQDARLAAAVKAGDLTQAQADAIKARRAADGTVLCSAAGRAGRAVTAAVTVAAAAGASCSRTRRRRSASPRTPSRRSSVTARP